MASVIGVVIALLLLFVIMVIVLLYAYKKQKMCFKGKEREEEEKERTRCSTNGFCLNVCLLVRVARFKRTRQIPFIFLFANTLRQMSIQCSYSFVWTPLVLLIVKCMLSTIRVRVMLLLLTPPIYRTMMWPACSV
jgi:Ca2+/Na+ antiporter